MRILILTDDGKVYDNIEIKSDIDAVAEKLNETLFNMGLVYSFSTDCWIESPLDFVGSYEWFAQTLDVNPKPKRCDDDN